jgi:hypothetical protein
VPKRNYLACRHGLFFDGEHTMPIRKILDGQAFDPETIQGMSEALAGACRALGLVDRDDPATRLVAAKIIALARAGERDPKRLEGGALQALRQAQAPARRANS